MSDQKLTKNEIHLRLVCAVLSGQKLECSKHDGAPIDDANIIIHLCADMVDEITEKWKARKWVFEFDY